MTISFLQNKQFLRSGKYKNIAAVVVFFVRNGYIQQSNVGLIDTATIRYCNAMLRLQG